MKICIDPGHGGRTSGAVGKYSKEKDINLAISLKIQTYLLKMGINVIMTRKDDSYVSLQKRCDIANSNKCDYFVSIHCNSFSNSSASGTETFYYPGSKAGRALASRIQHAAVAHNNNADRGVKTAQFYVIKYTNMVAVLHECAFISNKAEEDMLNNKEWQDGYAKSLAISIAQHVDVSSVDVEPVKVTRAKDSIAGSPYEEPIMQPRRATVEQMEKFVHDVNPAAPFLAEIFIKIGDMEGVRGDIAFAQSILETNYFRFTGTVKPEQNNFAGIGTTGPEVLGAYFQTAEEGIRAQIQHLKAYASKEQLRTPLIDPRFNLVKRGSAPNWQDLDGKWAVPGEGYGKAIINIWNRILSTETE